MSSKVEKNSTSPSIEDGNANADIVYEPRVRFIQVVFTMILIAIISLTLANGGRRRSGSSHNLQKGWNLQNEAVPLEIRSNITYEYLRDHFYIGDDWQGYRIGDMVRYHARNWKNGSVDCIINRYFNKTEAKSDYSSLLESVYEIGIVNNYSIAQDNTLVANLRLGDVHTYDNSTIKSYKRDKAKEILSYVQKHRLEGVYLISASHFPDHFHTTIRAHNIVNIERSVEIVLSIRKAVLVKVPVEIFTGRHPDEDFYFSSSAKHFLPDTGGYNKLCSEINKLWHKQGLWLEKQSDLYVSNTDTHGYNVKIRTDPDAPGFPLSKQGVGGGSIIDE